MASPHHPGEAARTERAKVPLSKVSKTYASHSNRALEGARKSDVRGRLRRAESALDQRLAYRRGA